MAAQPLGPAAAAALRLDRLEHRRHVARIVAGARHDLRAQSVGLTFVLAAVFRNAAPNPNSADRQDLTSVPPRIAPAICPIIEPTWYVVALPACAVPCRSATWLISCASTPAISPSFLAAWIIPRLTYIGPPGSANALRSLTLTTSNEYRNCGCRNSAGMFSRAAPPHDRRSRRCHRRSRSEAVATSREASRPGLTSSSTDIVFGCNDLVWPKTSETDVKSATTVAAARAERCDSSLKHNLAFKQGTCQLRLFDTPAGFPARSSSF